MRVTALLLCLAYWLMLTVLLLTSNPAGLVGLHSVPIFPWGKFGVHLTAFITLTVLVHTTCWPKSPRWYMLLILIIYAATTESLQLLVPHRTSRPMDCFENLLGVAIGTGIYWSFLRLMQPFLRLNLAARLVQVGCVGRPEKSTAK